jgi:site-specific recombinase
MKKKIKNTYSNKSNRKIKNDNVSGITSLVLGISGIVLPFIGLPLSILAVIFANKQRKIEPTSHATAGNVLGIIGIVLNGIMWFLVLISLLFVGSIITAVFNSTL